MFHSHHTQVMGLLISILIVNLASFFSVFQLETDLESTSSSNSLELYSLDSMKELRRLALLSSQDDRKAVWNASRQTNNKEFFEKVKIEAHCEKKERIGEKGDGGKYVCNPKMIGKDCTLLSLGLNNQIGYDKHIYEVTGKHCLILGADISPQNPATREVYQKMGGQLFVGKIPDTISIPQMLENAGRREVDLLKIDIERGEFTALEPLLKDFFVCQIFIEIHGMPSDHLRMLQIMARYGFRIFNVEENTLCPTCCEYSLINELCMAQYGVVPLAVIIPQMNA